MVHASPFAIASNTQRNHLMVEVGRGGIQSIINNEREREKRLHNQ